MIAILQWQKAIALESFIVANFEVALIKKITDLKNSQNRKTGNPNAPPE